MPPHVAQKLRKLLAQAPLRRVTRRLGRNEPSPLVLLLAEQFRPFLFRNLFVGRHWGQS